MRFEETLLHAIYPPWSSHYIDYAKLKKLLREPDSNPHSKPSKELDPWTAEDEGAFVEELLNVQLEKVNSFQVDTYKHLRERTSSCESRLEKYAAAPHTSLAAPESAGKIKQSDLKEAAEELDNITREISELEKFSRINFTGFLKAAKKHDRKRGHMYRVKPLLQVRLAALPFNSEDYSPLLYRLSALYSFVRQNREGEGKERALSESEAPSEGDKYTSHKYWVHPDNLLELKTYILRRLPVLVYNPQASRTAEGDQVDPTITSLYFDSPQFSLYTQKVDRVPDASSLRLRWYGKLSETPEILLEKKVIQENDHSLVAKFPIKAKYLTPFIEGTYKMEKSVEKLRKRQGETAAQVNEFENTVDDIQQLIRKDNLQPVLRANYSRTAFQVPGDNRIRISLDTNLALIREDSLDADRPCRDPGDWHRSDIDGVGMEYPFSSIRKGEISRFPYALLEIKVRDRTNKKTTEWISELTHSHLVKEAPRFSKFVHGVAQLFEDYVNSFPFWLSELDSDIRKDPEAAFEEEQQKKAQRAEEEFAVGSFLGSKQNPSVRAPIRSPLSKGKGREAMRYAEVENASAAALPTSDDAKPSPENELNENDVENSESGLYTAKRLRSLFPSFSASKYARAHRRREVELPPGVSRPGKLIKDSGPVKVEPKVWLANQRTFVKWQHISVLLASLSLGLYNAAGESNTIARGLAVVYTLIALFAGGWGYWLYITRSRMIQERSGKDFDSILGPIVVCVGLSAALCLNFGFKVWQQL
ncbi:MAG: Phosphate metabolism transcription protein [Trizodia sp. TS-e1964]|nr:MAG: Phosphate metabolism transcription protein [Trizodia sp. TS-e1964]